MTRDDTVQVLHHDGQHIKKWIFWGEEQWYPPYHEITIFYNGAGNTRRFDEEEWAELAATQEDIPARLLTCGKRQWWLFRDVFYFHPPDETDPEVIKGLILQKDQRDTKRRQKAVETARGSKPSVQKRPTQLPWHEVLDISRSASREQIVAAYRKKMQEYHPDRVNHLGDKLQQLAEEEAKAINRAYKEALEYYEMH